MQLIVMFLSIFMVAWVTVVIADLLLNRKLLKIAHKIFQYNKA